MQFEKAFKQRIDRAMDIIQHVCKITHDDWYEFFEILTAAEKQANQDSVRQNLFPSEEFEFKPFATDEPFSLNFEYAEEVYWQAGTKLRDNIVDIRPLVLKIFREKSVVVEFGQAFGLIKGMVSLPMSQHHILFPVKYFSQLVFRCGKCLK